VAVYRAARDAAREDKEPTPTRRRTTPAGRFPLQTNDVGFKDTVSANPGIVTRIRSPFDLPTGVTGTQKHVFHRDILEHEDNDMMRPYEVV
jgi:spore coat protein A, manganese oxidase